jgi:hypothetical protein
MRDELKWKEVDEQNAAIKWGMGFDAETSSEDGWPDILLDARWPNLEVGVEVSVEVHSEVGPLKGDSACRSPRASNAFQSLTYLASYVTAPSVLPSEVVPPQVVPIEDLTRSSSPASMLLAALSEALGISLSTVMDRYFNGSQDSERVRQIEEALERRIVFEEEEEWLAQASRNTSIMLEWIHRGQDDDSF